MLNQIKEPIKRSVLRQILGREYYILKRKFKWLTAKTQWSSISKNTKFENVVFKHKSMILRPLMGVDMQLQVNKKTNLKIAIQKINGMVIRSGETFSVWKNVGRPTKGKGYLEGLVLKQGKIKTGTGGGLCQLGNLLFWIFIHSPLTIKERYRHSYDVFPSVNRKVPFGAGATLSYNYIDLQIKNETENTFQIFLYIKDDYLYGELYSKNKVQSKFEIEERNHIMKQQFWGGYTRHNIIVQIETNEKNEKTEKIIAINNAIMMYNPILEKT